MSQATVKVPKQPELTEIQIELPAYYRESEYQCWMVDKNEKLFQVNVWQTSDGEADSAMIGKSTEKLQSLIDRKCKPITESEFLIHKFKAGQIIEQILNEIS